jgi:hypothetical protein
MLAVASYFLPLVLVEIVVIIFVLAHFDFGKQPYTYRITDLWAATLGLTPTLLLLAYTLKVIDLHQIMYWTKDHLVVMSVVLGISQCIGVFLGRLLAGPAMRRTRHATATSFIFILAGATCGFAAMFFYVFMVTTVLGRPL